MSTDYLGEDMPVNIYALLIPGKVVTWSCASSCRQICTSPPHPGALEQDLYKTASWFSCKWGEYFVHAVVELRLPLSSKVEWNGVCTALMKIKLWYLGTVMCQTEL